MGEALLDADRWERQYRLAFPLSLLLAESELFTGRIASADRRLHDLGGRAMGAADAAAVTSVRVGLCLALNQMNRAVDVCLPGAGDATEERPVQRASLVQPAIARRRHDAAVHEVLDTVGDRSHGRPRG